MPISTKFWGEKLWDVMYTFAFDFPKENPTMQQKQAALNFYNALRHLLPCTRCKEHYNSLLGRIPVDFTVVSRRETLISWVNKVHNETNKNMGKPTVKLSEVSSKIEVYRTTSPSTTVRSTPVPKNANATRTGSKPTNTVSKLTKVVRAVPGNAVKAANVGKIASRASGGCGCGR